MIKIKHDDNLIFESISKLSFEAEGTNIQVEHIDGKGFCVSIYDAKKKIMHYYDVVDGKLKLSSKEDVETGEDMLLRDDIRDKVFDLINADFVEPRFIVREQYNWIELNMDANDINVLATLLEQEFEIDFINPDDIQKWETVKDIVSYIDITLEGKPADDEEPYINGFEVEA